MERYVVRPGYFRARDTQQLVRLWLVYDTMNAQLEPNHPSPVVRPVAVIQAPPRAALVRWFTVREIDAREWRLAEPRLLPPHEIAYYLSLAL